MNSDIPHQSSEIPSTHIESRKQPHLKKDVKICSNCDLPIKGQFVRAVHTHFHLECFKCADCGKIVAEKFFPFPPASASTPSAGQPLPQNEASTGHVSNKTLIYCETDYFKRLDLLCARCGSALRGPYIRIGKQKYHMDHFSCSVCSTVFKQHDSYYEKDQKIYCAAHFSVLFAARCGGCSTAVLKNFVETAKDNKVTQWHPCCYSLSKLWGIKMNHTNQIQQADKDKQSDQVQIQKEMVERVESILHILSTFEESTAACVTEMLANFSNGNLLSGVSFARRLIFHIEVLFTALENVDDKFINMNDGKEYSSVKEPRSLAKKVVQLFSILSEKKETDESTVAATQEMIQLVTELSHLLKAIIRYSIRGAAKLDQIHEDKQVMPSLLIALQSISNFDDVHVNMSALALSLKNDDSCANCKKQIDDGACFKSPKAFAFKWHESCFKCSVCSVGLANVFQEASVNPSSGSVQCKTHRGPFGQIGIEKLLSYTQYICILNASWADLFSNLKIQELKPQESSSETKEVLLTSAPIPGQSRKEEFFDDEDGHASSPAARSETNRISGSGINWKITQEMDEKTPYLTEVSGLQFLATRQLAALALHRHLAKWFSLTKLLQIAEGPKTSIWTKMFSKKDKKKIDCTFGAPLDLLVENYGVDSTLGFGLGQVRIPIIVQESIIKLKQSGMTTEGIFRKNGNIRRLKEQCEEIDRDPKNINFQQDNEIQVAALLKKFLRDLPEPLMTETLYDLFLCVPKIDRKEDQVPVIQLIMCLLPKANIELLSVLVRFFVEVSANWGVHKMDLDNMATVIAPNILYNKLNPVENTAIVIDVIRLLFQSHSSIFKVPAAIKDSLASAEENPISVEFVKKYEQNLSKTLERQKHSEGTATVSS